jgi:hypothetical protein
MSKPATTPQTVALPARPWTRRVQSLLRYEAGRLNGRGSRRRRQVREDRCGRRAASRAGPA